MLYYQSIVDTLPYTVFIDSADYITFKDMTIGTIGTTYGKAIMFNHGATHNNIIGNYVFGTDTTDHVIFCDTDGNLKNSYNSFRNNYIIGGIYGFYWDGFPAYNDYTTLDSNSMNNYIYITHHNYSTITHNFIIVDEDNTNDNHMLYSHNAGNNTVLDGNYFCRKNNMNSNLMYLNDVWGDASVTNNILVGHANQNLITLDGDIEFIHNTIYQKNMDKGYALQLISDGIHLFNNNIVSESHYPAVIYNTSIASLISDYNNIYNAGKYSIRYGLEKYKTLEEWNAAQGHDAHSVSAYTGFIADTFMMTLVKAIDSTATNTTGVTVDFLGKLRDPNYPDIGAVEFDAPGPASGIFYVGSSDTATKPTLQAIIDSLALVGIEGNIEIQIEPGTYEEQVIIPQIYGLSDTSRLKITSQNGDSSSVSFEYDLEGNTDFVICLNGADYIDIEKLSFESLSSSYSKNLLVKNYSNYNNFKNNSFYSPPTSSYQQQDNALVYCTGYSQHNNLFKDNLLQNGVSGIAFFNDMIDVDTTNIPDIMIIGNKFIDQYLYGIYNNDFSHIIVDGNYFNSDGRYLDYTSFYFMDIPLPGTQIVNNILDFNTRFPIKTYNCDSIDFIHNTIRMVDGYGPQFAGTPVRFINNPSFLD